MLNESQPYAISTNYAGPARGQRYDAWREEIGHSFCKLDARASDGDRIDCRIEIAPVSSLAMASASGTSAVFSRTRELLSDNCDALVLIAATAGHILVGQQGQPVELQRSQMCLIDTSSPCSVDVIDRGGFTATRIPRRELLSLCPKAESRLSEPLRENVGLQETVARYFTLTVEMAGRLDTVGQQMTTQHMIDLIGLLLGTGKYESELASRRSLAPAQLQLMQSRTLSDLGDGALTVAHVAKHVGVSPRHAQRLFEQGGTTFTEFVLEHRLLLARKLLLNPSKRDSKISAIAYDAGFGDLSYFNRAFRKRFGVTPSELRTERRLIGFGRPPS
jgi:AraC-like DNA-binding protein